MVVVDRLLLLQQWIAEGYEVDISILPNAQLGRLKVKVLVKGTAGALAPPLRELQGKVLEQVAAFAEVTVSTDRGHRHSFGHSSAAFWFSLPKVEVLAPPVPPTSPAPPGHLVYGSLSTTSRAASRFRCGPLGLSRTSTPRRFPGSGSGH